MEENIKSKAQLIKEAQDIADKLIEKKEVIETALNDLDDKASKEGVTNKHMEGMSIIEQMFTEYDEIELEQLKVIEAIKNK